MDTPVRYSPMIRMDVTPPPPRWRDYMQETRPEHFNIWPDVGYRHHCDECYGFGVPVVEWMRANQQYGRYACADLQCHACYGWPGIHDRPNLLRGTHLIWAGWDHSTGKCTRCREKTDYCACTSCDTCQTTYVSSSETTCSGCGYHTGCQNCQCKECNRCENLRSTFCTNCNECSNCCDCVRCRYCGLYMDEHAEYDCAHNYCNSCTARCRDCNSGYFKAIESARFPWDGDKRGLKVNHIQRMLGVEIEAYAVYPWKETRVAVKKWQGGIVKDGSLTCDSGVPFEVTTTPAGGQLFVDQLTDICEALAKDKAKTNKTCGLHVHVDASSYKWWDVQRLIKLYSKVEASLFKVIAPYRDGNNYSQRCGQKFMNDFVLGLKGPKDLKKKMLRRIYGLSTEHRMTKTEVDEAYNEKYNNHRYHALNIHSWFRRGTIEFRHHHGVVDRDVILNWAILCGHIVTAAETMSDAAVDALATNGTAINHIGLPEPLKLWVAERKLAMTRMTSIDTDYQVSSRDDEEDDEEPELCSECDRETDYCECCPECGVYSCTCCGNCGSTNRNRCEC